MSTSLSTTPMSSTTSTTLVPYIVHRKLKFYQTPEYFYLKPIYPMSGLDNQILSINRLTNEINLLTNNEMESIEKSRAIFSQEFVDGIFGMIKLIAGYYLILITESSSVGCLQFGEDVFKIENVKIIPFNSALLPGDKQSLHHLSVQQMEYNNRYLSMIKSILQMPSYYYSYTYDLTSNMQRIIKFQPRSRTMIQGANVEFVWNRSLISTLMANQMFHYFCLPVVCGFVNIHEEMINQKKFKWILISRRSTNRCGTRWFARGINSNGWTANFIETEQILLTNQDSFSLVQIRGSIPLYWSQLPNLRYKPKFIIPNAPHIESYGHHVRRLSRDYGRLCFVNLISTHGSEGKLFKVYNEVVTDGNFNRGNDIPFVNFESFDFHSECRRGGWQALNKLMQQISPLLDEYGYAHVTKNINNRQPQVIRLQQGVIRSNCVDSLDRTNVVQSLIAKQILHKQLVDCQIISQFEKFEDFPKFDFAFRNIWADHADVCSTQYAGTGALKSDFTRTGKRRVAGMLADGLNSWIRYYKNNFEDGFRQDSLDLILGQYQVDEREGGQMKCPLENRNVWKIFFLPLLFLFSSLMFWLTLVFGSVYTDELHIEQALYTLFWFSMSSICFVIMFYLGHEFADYPTLVRRR